jgi:hypothetical protein
MIRKRTRDKRKELEGQKRKKIRMSSCDRHSERISLSLLFAYTIYIVKQTTHIVVKKKNETFVWVNEFLNKILAICFVWNAVPC